MTYQADTSGLDEMMEAIREELRQRRASLSPEATRAVNATAAPPEVRSSPSSFASHKGAEAGRWRRFEENMEKAQAYAPLSSLLPQFLEWSPYRRAIAQRIAKGVMYVSKFMINKQTLFNEAIFSAVQELSQQARAQAVHSTELERLLDNVESRVRALAARGAVRNESTATDPEAAFRVPLEARLQALTERLEALEATLGPPGRPK